MAKKAPTHGFCGGGGGEVTFVVRTKQKAPTLSSLSTTRALPLSLSLRQPPHQPIYTSNTPKSRRKPARRADIPRESPRPLQFSSKLVTGVCTGAVHARRRQHGGQGQGTAVRARRRSDDRLAPPLSSPTGHGGGRPQERLPAVVPLRHRHLLVPGTHA